MFKRTFDFCVSLLALVFFLPVMLCTAVLVAVKLGTPVIFTQVRPGLHGKPFKMIKFRSMTAKRDGDGKLLPDRERLTSFGTKLRASSLDELPGLINVLKGDISLVGPRPLLMEYLPLYNDFQKRRMEVKPGITGWAQVNGRNAIDWDSKFKLDVWYVDNRSFLLDIKILFLTVKKVLVKEGIAQEGSVATPRFLGNDR